jgi:TldD protein
MTFSRRQFLKAGAVGAASATAAAQTARLVEARGLMVEATLATVIERALAAAKAAGATYADIRVVRRRTELVATREARVESVNAGESYGLGVRVIARGAWGFAASALVTAPEAERVARLAVDIATQNSHVVKRAVTLAPVPAHVDVWQTPLTKDPFKIPLEDKAEFLLGLNAEAMKVKGVKFASSGFAALGEWKLFASSDGGYVEQEIVRLGPRLSATAVDAKSGEFVSRDHEIQPMQAGWEYVEGSSLRADARRIGEDAVEKLSARSVAPGKKDLVLAPTHLWLTIHESVGHPTELDRMLGYEANFAGTSFVKPAAIGKLDFAAPHVSFYADKTTPGALATCGYDDDGVKTQRWDIIKNGTLVGVQTTREQAAWIGERDSRGTSYAQDFRSFPFQRMPNVSLSPGEKNLATKDLIAATDDGVYITGNGSWSIDHQRYNFQFGGQAFYEIKKGKITGMLRDVAYQANTREFWHACDLLGGAGSWQLGGSLSDGKGEPSQSNAVSHGCPPARFRKIDVLNTNTKRGA